MAQRLVAGSETTYWTLQVRGSKKPLTRGARLGVPVEPAHRAGKIEAARPAEGSTVVALHAPVEHFAEHMERQRAHAALAVRKHRAVRLGERLLEGPDVGLGDAGPVTGMKA